MFDESWSLFIIAAWLIFVFASAAYVGLRYVEIGRTRDKKVLPREQRAIAWHTFVTLSIPSCIAVVIGAALGFAGPLIGSSDPENRETAAMVVALCILGAFAASFAAALLATRAMPEPEYPAAIRADMEASLLTPSPRIYELYSKLIYGAESALPRLVLGGRRVTAEKSSLLEALQSRVEPEVRMRRAWRYGKDVDLRRLRRKTDRTRTVFGHLLSAAALTSSGLVVIPFIAQGRLLVAGLALSSSIVLTFLFHALRLTLRGLVLLELRLRAKRYEVQLAECRALLPSLATPSRLVDSSPGVLRRIGRLLW